MTREAASGRERTNVTLPETLRQEARRLKINLSQVCERGLATEVAAVRGRNWQQENEAAMAAWNTYVEEHDVPLAGYRQF